MWRKQKLSEKNNPKENLKPHRYIVREKVLVSNIKYKIKYKQKNTRIRKNAPTQLPRYVQMEVSPYAGTPYMSA